MLSAKCWMAESMDPRNMARQECKFWVQNLGMLLRLGPRDFAQVARLPASRLLAVKDVVATSNIR